MTLRYDRSGTRLGVLRLGRVLCIRQELLRPADRYRLSLGGRVRLGALREQEAIPMHCHIEAYVTPLRWLWPGYVDYVLADHSAAVAHPPVHTGNVVGGSGSGDVSPDYLGIGDLARQREFYQFYLDNYLRVYNEYYKWPEDDDATEGSLASVPFPHYGLRSVQMEAFDTRMRSNIRDDAEDRFSPTVSSGVSLTDLVQTSARLRLGQTQEWLTSSRYRETLKEYFGGAGSHEVDQVPISYGGPAGWLTAENIWATDGGSLGTIRAIHEFDIQHSWGRVSVPEHSVLSVMMTVRPQRLLQHMVSPHASSRSRSRAEILGLDPLLEVEEPRQWDAGDFVNGGSGVVGKAPAGHEWRTGWDMVDREISRRSFTTGELRLATHPYCPDYEGFVSASLGQGIFRVNFGLQVDSDIHAPMASVMTGASL